VKKTLAKRFVIFLSSMGVSPLVVVVRLHKYLFKSDNLFASCGQTLALVPGKLGSYLRCAYYRFTLKRFSGEGFIGFGSYFPHASAEVGEGVYIGAYCIIGNVSIGEGSLLASRVSILSGAHQHSIEGRGIRGEQNNNYYRRTEIGKGCWVGEGSVVMADVGDFSVVGAGSVVTRTIPEGVIAAGNPARVIKEISTSEAEKPTLKGS
jgi:acetyltransferase-like isoleucine patch superfamily enzyme